MYDAAAMKRLALLLPLLVAGCATVKVGDYTMQQSSWDQAQTEVKERASFELKCPKEQLKLTLLAALYPVDTHGNLPKQIGVDGCGHRLVYVVSHSGWVLNSSDGDAK